MSLVISFFSMLAGIIAVIISAITSKKNMTASERWLAEIKRREDYFKKYIANRATWEEYSLKQLDEEFRDIESKKYEDVVRELNLPEEKWLSKKYRRIFSFRVYMASIGKLDPETGWSYHAPPIPNHYCKDYCDHNDQAHLYKWIDKTIHTFHPQYSVVRINENGTYRYRWNFDLSEDGTLISELSDNEVLKIFANE